MKRRFLIPSCLILSFLPAARLVAQQIPTQTPYTWKNAKIVAGGFVDGIIFSPLEKDLAYVKTDMGGAYRFDASSRKWLPITDWVGPRNGNYNGPESIALDPTDANTVYLALGTYSNGPACIARSSDRGKTFQCSAVPFNMGSNEDGRSVGERLAVDPNSPNVLYFGSRHAGLWKSTDSAVTWKKVDSFPLPGGAGRTGLSFVLFDSRRPSSHQPTASIFVGVADPGKSNLYHSADAGKTWSAVSGSPPNLLAQRGALDSAGALYITFTNSPGPNGITGGAVEKFDIDQNRWTDISPPQPKGQTDFGYCGLAIDPHRPGTLLVASLDRWNAGDEIYRSIDSGKSWKGLAAQSTRDPSVSPYLSWGQPVPRFGWWLAALAIDPFDSDHVMYGTGATIWGTQKIFAMDDNKPTHWSVQADGIEETAVLSLISPPMGPHLISGVGDIGGFVHLDLNVSPPAGFFTAPTFTNTNHLDFAWQKPSVIVRTGTGGKSSCAFSEDTGKTWHAFDAGPTPTNARGNRGTPDILLSSDGTTFLRIDSGPTFSNDRGATWTPCKGLFVGARPIPDKVALAKFYALDVAGGKIYTSTDNGATFTSKPSTGAPSNISQGRGRGFAGGSRLKSSPDAPGDLWLAAGALYHSVNAGETFQRATPDGITVNQFALGMAAPGRKNSAIFIYGTEADIPGIYRSDDDGATWLRLNDDQHQFGGAPSVLTADPRIFGRVYLGMNGRGVIYGSPTDVK